MNHIGKLAEMISLASDTKESASEILGYLTAGHQGLQLIELDNDRPDPVDPHSVVDHLGPFFAGFIEAKEAALAGDTAAALTALASTRVLCGHRHGPYGVSMWNGIVADRVGVSTGSGSIGLPLLNTRNDLRTGLVNGDTGIVTVTPSGKRVVFPGNLDGFEPTTLENVEVAFATTVHKSQGSEFTNVVVVLPPVGSPLLRRELLYTAVTRATTNLVVIATKEAVLEAMTSTITRQSGLADRIRG